MKIKVTEDQIKKIQEDNLMDRTDPIDGFIQQGNISGLAHHYAKADDVSKQGIIDKATAAKGDVFAQRIKLKAQGVMEGEHPDPFPMDEEEKQWMEENNVPIPMNSGGYNDRTAEAPLEETTTTGSVGGQYSSKYFLDKSHAKNPPSIFKGGTVIKPNDKTHTQGINSFTVIKGKLKEDIQRIVQENENVESGLITYKNSTEQVDPKDGKSVKRAQWIMANDPDFVKFEIFKGSPEHDVVIYSTDQDRNKQAEINKSKEMQQPIQQEASPIQPEVTAPALVSQEPMVDEDLEQSLTDQANYNKVPKAVIKYANVLNDLIKQCVDADGDPVGVYDNSSSWQEEFIYTIDIIKNRVYIKSFDRTGKEDGYPEIFPNMNKRAWDEWTVNDCIDSIKHLIKNYRRTIKSLPKRQAAVDAEFVDEAPVVQEQPQAQPQMAELETAPDMNSTVQSVSDDLPDDGGLQDNQEVMQETFSTEDLYEIYEKVCQDTGEDSEHAQKLKNILIEFGDYEQPHMPVNSQAIEEFKNILPDEGQEPVMGETTSSASSGQYSAPLQGRPNTPADYVFEEQPESVPQEQSTDGQVVDQYVVPAWAVRAIVDNSLTDEHGQRLSNEQIQYVTEFVSSVGAEHGSTKFAVSSEHSQEPNTVVVDLLAREEGNQQQIAPATSQEQPSVPLQEETLTISPTIANLKRIHGETAKITKAGMQRIKNDTLKATEADGTQFIDNTNGVDSSDSPNAIGIDPTPQQDAVNLIRKGMEDLNYDAEPGKAFEDRFEDNIDRDLSTDAVTDQFGHKTPADTMVNVLKSDVGANIVKSVEKRKEEEEGQPMYDKDPQPVKTIKEEVVRETDEYIITESEQKLINENAIRMKEMMGYKPSKGLSTKGNKRA